MVFQTSGSSFHLSVLGDKPLPMMRFHLTLEPNDERAVNERKLFDIILKGSSDAYFLDFRFGDAMGAEAS